MSQIPLKALGQTYVSFWNGNALEKRQVQPICAAVWQGKIWIDLE